MEDNRSLLERLEEAEQAAIEARNLARRNARALVAARQSILVLLMLSGATVALLGGVFLADDPAEKQMFSGAALGLIGGAVAIATGKVGAGS